MVPKFLLNRFSWWLLGVSRAALRVFRIEQWAWRALLSS